MEDLSALSLLLTLSTSFLALLLRNYLSVNRKHDIFNCKNEITNFTQRGNQKKKVKKQSSALHHGTPSNCFLM